MRSATLFVALLALFAVAFASNYHSHPKCNLEEFARFKAQFNKVYESDAEEAKRFDIFCRNLQRIDIISKNAPTATFGINKFADLTQDEFRSTRVSHKNFSPEDFAKNCLATKLFKRSPKDIPTSVDWRSQGKVTPVKDQGQCGSCWAFSTISAVESAFAIKTGNLVSLSEQMLVDCSKGCTKIQGQSVCNEGCNGGFMWTAMFDIMNWGGVVTESDLPYLGVDKACTILNQNPKLTARIANYTCLSGPSNANEDDMAAYIAEHGPLAIGINADMLQYYYGGIINPSWSWECSPSGVDHGVTIVGYGEDNGTKYFIVRNSWGADWGEKGYFRIVRGKGACGINTGVVGPIMA